MLGILKDRVLWLLWDTSPAAGRRFMALVLCKLERSRSAIHPAHFCSSFLKWFSCKWKSNCRCNAARVCSLPLLNNYTVLNECT